MQGGRKGARPYTSGGPCVEFGLFAIYPQLENDRSVQTVFGTEGASSNVLCDESDIPNMLVDT